jgi:flagellin
MNLSHHSLSLAAGLGRLESLRGSTVARVSSGNRLDRPSTDPAALAQSGKLVSEQSRLRAAEVNIQNGVSRLQVTNGQLNALDRIVTRLSEITTLAGNPAQNPGDRANYAAEFGQLQQQIRQIVGGSAAEIGGSGVEKPLGQFNERALFGSGPGDTLVIGSSADDRLTLPVLNLRAGPVGELLRQDASGAFVLGLGNGGAPASPELGATLRAALGQIAEAQAELGSGQSRLLFSANVVATARENHEAALSTILDADLAVETTELARFQILAESRTAMLAHARDAGAKLLPLLARR